MILNFKCSLSNFHPLISDLQERSNKLNSIMEVMLWGMMKKEPRLNLEIMRTRELQLQVDRLKGTLIERDINWEQKFRERTCR